MAFSRCILALSVLWFGASAHAQAVQDPKKVADAVDQSEVRFTDDSIVRMLILQDRLEVDTKYGKLSIPVADILKVDFGIHVSEDQQKKIAQAIEELGSENYKTRELAVKNLVGWGPYAYPQVYKACKSDQPEVKKRAQMAMDKLKAKHPARNLRLREEDIIVTQNFTVVGKITTLTIKAKAENFGELELQLAKLRGIRSLTGSAEVDLTLDATKYANVGQWMDSGFEVREGMRLHVEASGTVNLWPQNGGFISTPKGFTQQGFIQGPGTQHYPGTLLGRIGTDGQMFVLGDRYDGPTNREGKLYLHIAPSPWMQNGSTGSYAVKISAGGFGE
jgi:hypothetical protein